MHSDFAKLTTPCATTGSPRSRPGSTRTTQEISSSPSPSRWRNVSSKCPTTRLGRKSSRISVRPVRSTRSRPLVTLRYMSVPVLVARRSSLAARRRHASFRELTLFRSTAHSILHLRTGRGPCVDDSRRNEGSSSCRCHSVSLSFRMSSSFAPHRLAIDPRSLRWV